MTTLSGGKVWGNDGGPCGRGAEEVMKGMIERVGVCSWLIEVSLLSDEGFVGDTQTSPQPIFMTRNPPVSSSLAHSPRIPPSPSSLLPWPQATWVGCTDLYLCACVCVVCVYVHVWGNEAVPQATLSIRQTHYQPIGIPDNRPGYQPISFMYMEAYSTHYNHDDWKYTYQTN